MSKLPRKQVFDVSGENQTNEDGSYRQKILQVCLPGEALTLERQPQNPHDQNAIFIRQSGSGLGIGYVSRDSNAELAAALDAGIAVKARLHELTGGLEDYPNFGCRICVVGQDKAFREMLALRPEQRFYEHAPVWRQSKPTFREKRKPNTGGLMGSILKLFK